MVAFAAQLATGIQPTGNTKGQRHCQFGNESDMNECLMNDLQHNESRSSQLRLLTGVADEPNITAVGGFVYS